MPVVMTAVVATTAVHAEPEPGEEDDRDDEDDPGDDGDPRGGPEDFWSLVCRCVDWVRCYRGRGPRCWGVRNFAHETDDAAETSSSRYAELM